MPDGWVVDTELKRTSSPAATVPDVVPTDRRAVAKVPLVIFDALVVSAFLTLPKPTWAAVTECGFDLSDVCAVSAPVIVACNAQTAGAVGNSSDVDAAVTVSVRLILFTMDKT